MEETFQSLVLNVMGKARHARLHGRDHLVVPVVMITEGVHEGDGGPILYEEPDIEEAVDAWNHKPIIVYHPKQNKVSACTEKVLNEQGCGLILNTRWDKKAKKLRAEAWFDVEKTKEVDDRVFEAIDKAKLTEVSTGLYMNVHKVEGVWGDRKYMGKSKKHRPDHLAVLPDTKGACSVADGAGLFQNEAVVFWKGGYPGFVLEFLHRLKDNGDKDETKDLASKLLTCNELSLNQVSANVQTALASKFGEKGKSWNGWVQEVYKEFVIYYQDGKLWKADYTLDKNDAVTIDGEAVEVRRDTAYKVLNGEAEQISNADPNPPVVESDMEKKEIVNKLIANSGGQWEEADREELMKMSDKQLNKLLPKATPSVVPQPVVVVNQQKDPPLDPDAEKPKKHTMTEQEWLASAPADMRRYLLNKRKEDETEKDQLVKELVANANVPFAEEYLKEQTVDVLRGLAAMAKPPEDETVVAGTAPLYPIFKGAQGAPVHNAAGKATKQAPLEPLTVDWNS